MDMEMEKKKNLQEEEKEKVAHSSEGVAEENAPQVEEITFEPSSEVEQPEAPVAETAAPKPESGESEFTQQSGEEQKPQDGQTAPPAAVVAPQPAIEELQDRFLRLAADFANYKRRNESEKMEIADYARREVARALLPILDDFALMVEYEAEHPERLAEGAKLIRQKLMELLSKLGLERIEALNQPFDYERHEAVLTQPVQDKALDHTVLSVMQEGYLFKGKVLRPSKVIVGQYAGEESPPSSSSDAEEALENGDGEK